MKICFDAEFTGLTSDPRLLSIAFVADNGQELYIELIDGWSEAMCSPWVREHVMPMLGKGERLTRRETGSRIRDWMSSFETPPVLLGETDWDTALFAEIMNECKTPRDSYRLEMLAFSNKVQADSFREATRQYFEREHVVPHHALSDARAFHAAWKIVFTTT